MTEGAMILANAGTPLMWAGVCHLVALNVPIALIEAATIRAFVGGRLRPLFLGMLLVNYASMIAGYLMLDAVGDLLSNFLIADPPVTGFATYAGAIIAVVFFLTLAVECGLVGAALRFFQLPPLPTLLSVLLGNVVTNAALVVLFAWLSVVQLPPGLKIVDASELTSDPKAMLYWIDSEGSITAREILAGEALRIGSAASIDSLLWLSIANDTDAGNLWLMDDRMRDSGEFGFKVAKVGHIDPDEAPPLQGDYNRDYFVDLQRPAYQRFKTKNWRRKSLGTEILDPNGKMVAQFAVDIPGYSHESRTHVLLPDGQVVLTLGDSICLYDIETNRIALLAKGRGPVVVPSAWRIE